jgi:hypothetical protein
MTVLDQNTDHMIAEHNDVHASLAIVMIAIQKSRMTRQTEKW